MPSVDRASLPPRHCKTAAPPNQAIADAPGSSSVEYGLLVALSTLWGASYLLIRVGVATIPPLTLIAGRTLIAGTLLMAWIFLRGITVPRDPALWHGWISSTMTERRSTRLERDGDLGCRTDVRIAPAPTLARTRLFGRT